MGGQRAGSVVGSAFRHAELNLWRTLFEGAGVGAVGGVLLTARNLFDVLLDDRFGGVTAPAIHRFLATEYRFEVLRSALELFALSLVVGTVSGVLVATAWLMRRSSRAAPSDPWWQRIGALSVGTALLFCWMYWHDVAARPALHQPELLERGGVGAWLQILVADRIGRTGVATIGLCGIVIYVAWPWRDRIRSGAAWSASTWRGRDPFGRLRLIRPAARWRWLALPLLGCLGVASTLWWWLGASSNARRDGAVQASRAPNVLLIAADSLRPDRLDERRAPRIARLLQRAASFERAYTPLARTFPAWISIATGQYPQHHGIRHMFPRWETRQREFDTLAKRFSEAGYRTSVVGDFAADIFRRVDLGYERVNTPTFTMRELVREHMLKNDPWLLAWLRGSLMRWLVPVVVEMHEATDPTAVSNDAIGEIDSAGQRPFFVTVFYSTTHFPYAAPGPYYRRFTEPNYVGPYRYAKADTLNATEVMSPSDIDQVRALYDGAVFATDEAIGTLLDALDARGLSERTIVVVTADHGEELYEHGRSQGHGDHLQGDEALLVPLVIADPRQPNRVRQRLPVSLVDLAPTLLELANLHPLSAADGHSLVSSLRGAEPVATPVYSETGLWFTEVIAEVPLARRIPYPDLTQISEVDRKHSDQIVIRQRWEAVAVAAKHRMLQRGDLRLLYVPTRDGGKFELCDLATDPGCARDCSDEHAEAAAQLKAQFWQFVADDPIVTRRGEMLQIRTDPSGQPAVLGAQP